MMSDLCPDCKGTGKTGPVHVNYGYDQKLGRCRGEWKDNIPCSRCNGSGTVPDEMAEWIYAGRKMRDARVARGESIYECAKRLGTSSAELSAIERGYRGSNTSLTGGSAATDVNDEKR